MKQASVIAFCLFTGSALAAACSGFSSSSETSNGSDGGDAGAVGESGVVQDSGVTRPLVDAAECPTELEQADAAGNRVFVTEKMSANFGGIAAANAFCQKEGSRAYGGNWHAWISTLECPASARFVKRPRFLVLEGGAVGELGDNSSPTKQIHPSDLSVWTGTSFEGKGTGVDCAGWTSSDATLKGTNGTTRGLSTSWTDNGDEACNIEGRLYCFEL